MAKSAQQRLNAFFDESDATRATIKAFSDAAYEAYGTHSYAAGYLESAITGLIMQLPKAKREEARRDFEQAALRQRQTISKVAV